MRAASLIWIFGLVCLAGRFGAAETNAEGVATQDISRNPILSALSHYELVKPVPQASAGSNLQPLIDTDRARSHLFPDSLSYLIRAFDKDFQLSLQKNNDLISADYVELRLDNTDPASPVVERRSAASARGSNCYYRGTVQGDDTSYVAVSACSGLRGVISAHGELLNIEPSHFAAASFDESFYAAAAITGSSGSISARVPTRRVHSAHVLPVTALHQLEHVVYRDSQLTDSEATADQTNGKPARCGVEHSDHDHPAPSAASPSVQSMLLHEIGANAGTSVINLFVANDNKRYRSYGEGTEHDTLAIVNLVSQFYAATPFSVPVRVTLAGQITFQNGDPYTVRQGADGTGVSVMAGNGLLYTWLDWQLSPSSGLPSHNSGQLMSGLMFEDGIRGLAGVGSMCSTQSGSITQMTSQSLHTRAMISAHETGHTLGMEHDGVSNSCPGRGFIMQTVTGTATEFSSCSLTTANTFLRSGGQCLATWSAIKADPEDITTPSSPSQPTQPEAPCPAPSPATAPTDPSEPATAAVQPPCAPNQQLYFIAGMVSAGASMLAVGVVLGFVLAYSLRRCRRVPGGENPDPAAKDAPRHVKLVELANPSDAPLPGTCEATTSSVVIV